MRYQGQPALALQIANAAGGNIVDIGKALEARIAALEAALPAGIEVHNFAWQSDLVIEAIDGFVINLAEAVLIVLVVLAVFMSWRMGLIIGWALLMTILGTFIVLRMLDIELHRVSLGALVVALGMMADRPTPTTRASSGAIARCWRARSVTVC